MTVHLIIPIKARAFCKTRLAPHLSPDERIALARDMLDHVVTAARRSGAADAVILLSPDRDLVPTFVTHRVDAGDDLNAALTGCVASSQALGATAVVILLADLPLLAPEDVHALLAALRTHPVALAPDTHATGTNAIALRLPSRFGFAFGADSFSRHRRQAELNGLGVAVVRREGLGLDVDRIEDLQFASHRRDARLNCGAL